tara:strand:- start:99 stop:638 length:540 start_codon:yes stop_codon:yes gene_type:complete
MKQRGFTLIELMIVIAIIGILVSVAMPSYRHYVLESQREDTMAKLLQIIQLQERFYLNTTTYAANMGGDFNLNTGLGFTINAAGQWVINYNGAATYGIRIMPCADATIYPDAPNASQCFMAVAVPISGVADEDSFMGFLATDSRGRKVWDFNKLVIRDWDGNDLPNARCPECIAARNTY